MTATWPDCLDGRTAERERGAIRDRGVARADADLVVRAGCETPTGREVGVVLSAVVGSQAQGLATEDSDIDRRGLYVPSPEVLYSLDGAPEQLVHDGDQLCYWEASKFLRLALAANPTVLETLFSPEVEATTPAARAIVDARESLLSRRASQSFGGYAESQFQKMQRSRERGGGIKWQHAMHLIRLLRVGIDLGRRGTLDVTVDPEHRDELMAIRRGERSWEDVAGLRAQLLEEFDAAFRGTTLPEEPDRGCANELFGALRLTAAGVRA